MKTLRVRNDQDRPVQLMLEPSGHCFEMPPGAVFEVLPQIGKELDVYHHDPDLMIAGDVAKVLLNGEVLASWERPGRTAEHGRATFERIETLQELRAYFEASGERISAEPNGVLISRDVLRRTWGGAVRWRDEQELVHVEAVTAIRAPIEREPELALTISRIHAKNASAGFRIIRPPGGELGITYGVILMMDERRSIATRVLRRAVEVCFDMVMRYSDRLEAVANGNPDPGTP